MSKAFFIDTTRCTACRACQVACKQWHDHKAVPTKQRGTHQNPPDLTSQNYKLVRFSEHMIDGRVQWLFFPDQCRHCDPPPCKAVSDMYVDDAIIIDETTNAVICTEESKKLTEDQCQEVREGCPYDIPRRNDETGALTKCDMCIDRVQAGLLPMCVKSCCTGTMHFGDREDMVKLAHEHLEKVKKEFPDAELLDEDYVSVIFLVSHARGKYHEYAHRSVTPFNRSEFLAKIISPVKNILT